MIDTDLLKDLSGSLEDFLKLKRTSRSAQNLELIEKLPVDYQIKMMNKMFGENFQRNSFFDKLDVSFTILLLSDIKMEHIREGEYIYHVHQPSTDIFLILDGRVTCLLTRNLCFKSYPTGSYFGDMEFFRNSPRLFSVRALQPTVLLRIPTGILESAFKTHPATKLLIMKRSIMRYVSFKNSVSEISRFHRINMNDEFWGQLKYPFSTDPSINQAFDKIMSDFMAGINQFPSRYASLTAEKTPTRTPLKITAPHQESSPDGSRRKDQGLRLWLKRLWTIRKILEE